MKTYRSGHDLEDAIFGRHSSGEELIAKFWGQRPDFDKDVKRLIMEGFDRHPDTPIGRSLFLLVEKWLSLIGVNPKGLVFLSAIDTKVDLRHFADGVFFLPSIPTFPITVDAFNIDWKELLFLRDSWIDSFEETIYTISDFQSDLFRYKVGFARWKKDAKMLLAEKVILPLPADFRNYTAYGRPENHFVLTPTNIGTHEHRREFARMVARYLASKVFGQKRKTAQQSYK
ncbi:MAG: hypothetical protein AAB350_02370 [Patescibacteria group bacterium]